MAADNPDIFFELVTLLDKGHNIIKNGGWVYSKYLKNEEPILRILKYSLQRAYISWDILLYKQNYYVCRLMWYYLTDYDKFHSPVERLKHSRNIEPTITFKCLRLKGIDLPSSIEKLKKANPLILHTDDIEFDGISYELFISGLIKRFQFKYEKGCKREITFFEEFVRMIDEQSK